VENAMRAEQQEREEALADARAACDQEDSRPETATTQGGVQVTLTRRTADPCLPQPGAESFVLVHYEGALVANGAVFDSSYARGQPAEFPLAAVVPGWQEGLQLLKPGDEASLQIPAALGYGAQGAPPDIPPNADLRFKVELLAFANSPTEAYYAPGFNLQEGE
jgi:FKBP-type peptidyl-prolyl cis-trans isomerase